MNINGCLDKLKKYIEEEDFKGYDPYDALNSPILKLLSLHLKYPRIFFTQALKRLPFNVRPLLGIKKEINPKGLGLFLWGYAKLYAVEKKQIYLTTINRLLNLIEGCKSKGYSGNCWGYNFDWQSRAFFVPKFTPTIVNSSFIGNALIDVYRLTGLKQALRIALPIKDFIMNDLNRTKEGNYFCFSYTPNDHTAIHNANLLGASFLIRIYKYCHDENLREAALSGLNYSLKYQHPDGSWYYAETEFQDWIDSFHTGFNLQSILYFIEEGFCDEQKEEFEKGIKFYHDNFFLDDGTPKYYHNKAYPIDIHSPAQAIVLFSKMGNDYKLLTDKLVHWMIKHLQDETGYFYFQGNQHFTNKIPYMRWSQAWAFQALTEYYFRFQTLENKHN